MRLTSTIILLSFLCASCNIITSVLNHAAYLPTQETFDDYNLLTKQEKIAWIEGVWDYQVNDSLQYIMIWQQETDFGYRGQIKEILNNEKKVYCNLSIHNMDGFVQYQVKQKGDAIIKKYTVKNISKKGFKCVPADKSDFDIKFIKLNNSHMDYIIYDNNTINKEFLFDKRDEEIIDN